MSPARPLQAGAGIALLRLRYRRFLWLGLAPRAKRTMGNWTLDTIDWGRFDASRVDPEILRNIKAAAMVERNGGDYGIYLSRVFADDPAFIMDVQRWVDE